MRLSFSRLFIAYLRLTYGHLMTSNDQHVTCTNPSYGNQTMTNKHCLELCPQLIENRKKYNIQKQYKTLLENYCEVEKTMKFLRNIEIFEK